VNQSRVELVCHLDISRLTWVNTILQIRACESSVLVHNPDWRGRRVLGRSPRRNCLVEILNLFIHGGKGDYLRDLCIQVSALTRTNFEGRGVTMILITELLARI